MEAEWRGETKTVFSSKSMRDPAAPKYGLKVIVYRPEIEYLQANSSIELIKARRCNRDIAKPLMSTLGSTISCGP